jgi:hypothetical protein
MLYLLRHAPAMAKGQILCQSIIMYVEESDGLDDLSNIVGPKANAKETSCEFGILV